MRIKIRSKLLIGMLIIGIVASIPITFISMSSLIKSSKDQAKDFGEKSVYYNSEIIKTWLSEKSDILMGLKIHLESFENEEDIRNLLKVYSDINNDFISIFIGFEDNRMIDAYGWIPDKSYKVTERPWYQKAVNHERYVTTSVYEDVNKKENVTAIASSINLNGKEGVIAANIYVNYVIEIIDDIRYGDNGFAVLLDDNYNLITGPMEMEKLDTFSKVFNKISLKDMKQGDAEAFEIIIDGTEYIAAYSSIEDFDWNLFLIAPLSDFINSAYVVKNQMIYILIGILLIIILLDYYLSRSISRPVEALIKGISGIANGDFDTPIHIETQDEIGNLTKELEKMRLNMKKIFESLKYESKIISMNSQNLTQHLNETYQGTSRFISMLSHDIKTPITLIKGYSKALSMDMVDPEKAKDYIERIHYRSEQIENIVSDTLDNTYEAENLRVNLKEIRIVDYINTVIYNSENYISNQNRVFAKKVGYKGITDQMMVAIDLTKIQRAINNLLSNAVKFSEENSVIELIIEIESDRIFTCFKDNGKGIKEEEKDKIFNMFYKSDNRKKGYGLGLYINKAIIEAHGGEVFFSSEYGKGTSSGYYLNLKNE